MSKLALMIGTLALTALSSTACSKPKTTPLPASSAAPAASAAPGAGAASMSLEDFQARRLRVLQRFDTDHDGKLSRAEFEAMLKQRSERTGKPMPAADRLDRQFQRQDANGDGFISQDETRQFAITLYARRQARAATQAAPSASDDDSSQQ